MDIVILAGGKLDPLFSQRTGVDYRALLPLKDERLIDVILKAVDGLGNSIVVADFPIEGVQSIPAGKSFVDSLKQGIDHVTSSHFLLCTADMPFITRNGIDDFLNQCVLEKLLNYPIIPMQLCDAKFPGMTRTTLNLKEGAFTGGNIALVRTDMMRRVLPALENAYQNRKNVLRLGGMLGWGTVCRLIVARFFPKTLSIAILERAVARFLQGSVKAVISNYAELGADIDSEEQYLAILALQKVPNPPII